MGLEVVGHDPAAPDSLPADEVLRRADVLVFCVPLRRTAEVIDAWRVRASGAESRQLWIDLASLKEAPMAALLRSRAEAVGLHPMTAPPKSPTLKGRVTVVCEGRLADWKPWLERLLAALETECVLTTPERHDRIMARVQALVHAMHLAQVGALPGDGVEAGMLDALLPFRSALFEMDVAIASRIFALNPGIYEDIQFENPHVGVVLRAMLARLQRLAALVDAGDAVARASFRREFLDAGRAAFGARMVAGGNYTFERLAYLLADLNDPQTLSVHLPVDRPGSLRALLEVFERHAVNIASLHSSRTPAGELHFRFGFDAGTAAAALSDVARELAARDIGRVLTD